MFLKKNNKKRQEQTRKGNKRKQRKRKNIAINLLYCILSQLLYQSYVRFSEFFSNYPLSLLFQVYHWNIAIIIIIRVPTHCQLSLQYCPPSLIHTYLYVTNTTYVKREVFHSIGYMPPPITCFMTSDNQISTCYFVWSKVGYRNVCRASLWKTRKFPKGFANKFLKSKP